MVVMLSVYRRIRLRSIARAITESEARLPGFRASGTMSAFILITAFGLLPAQSQVSPEVSAACALSGQSPEAPFDPKFVEFVSSPRPFDWPIPSQDAGASFKMIARVVGVAPPVFEVLDIDREPAFAGICTMMRIYSVDARLRSVLPRLRFGDLVNARVGFAEGILVPLILFEVEKIQGEPSFYHKASRPGFCSSQAAPLVVYRKHVNETLVVRNDGSIYYADKFSNVLDGQHLGREELARLMRTFQSMDFNGFASSLPPIEKNQPSASVTLLCTRHQRVLLGGREVALAPVLAALDEVKAKALSGSYYLLKYDEKRPITLLDWPFPNLPLSRAEEIIKAAVSEESKARRSGGHATGAIFQDLPAEFLAKLPGRFPPQSSSKDPNRDTFIREGSKLFWVELRCGLGGANCRRFDGLLKWELKTPDAFLAGVPRSRPVESSMDQLTYYWRPPDDEPPYSELWNRGLGLLWPPDAPIRLSQVPSQGQPIGDQDLDKYCRLYRELITMPSPGLRFIEDGYVYDGVRIARAERQTQTTTLGAAR